MSDRFRYYQLNLDGAVHAVASAGAWIRNHAMAHGLSNECQSKLELCAEELLTNVCKYSCPGREGLIRLDLLLDLDSATLTVIDNGPPFDPSTWNTRDTPTSLELAEVGGLGIHLVRNFADEMRYERQDGSNRLTICIGSDSLHLRHGDRRQKAPASFPLVRSDGTTVQFNNRRGMDRRALGFVAQTAVFRDIPFAKIERILSRCEVRSFGTGEILLQAGTSHRCVLIVIDGHVEVHLEGPDSKFFFDLGPGECVGEMSVADGKPSSAWVLGGTTGRVLVIPEPVFLGDVLGVPEIARNMVVMMSERMRRITAQTVDRLRATLELETLQRDLDIARNIQFSMLPASPLFELEEGISGHGFMRTARQVGGDFYDAFPIGGSRYFVAIGDVCGKGMPAALFMVRTLTLLRGEILRSGKHAERQLARIVSRANDELCENNGMQQFVTIFCAIVDVVAGRLDYVNVGHNPPLLRYPGEAPRFLDQPRNPLAGLFPSLHFVAGSCDFPVATLLFLYTDGVTEAQNERGMLFGDEALFQIFSAMNELTTESCIAGVVSAVDDFSDGYVQSDDITLLAISH